MSVNEFLIKYKGEDIIYWIFSKIKSYIHGFKNYGRFFLVVYLEKEKGEETKLYIYIYIRLLKRMTQYKFACYYLGLKSSCES